LAAVPASLAQVGVVSLPAVPLPEVPLPEVPPVASSSSPHA
jgi:hypothetical protein